MVKIKSAVLLIAIGSCLQVMPQATDSRQVQKALTQMLNGIANRDIAMIRHYSMPDCQILEDGHLYNLDSITKHMAQAKSRASTRVNHLYIATTRVDGNTAWLAFTDIVNITVNGKTAVENYLESAYLTKVAHAWKVQMIHSTTVTTYVK